MLLVQGEYEGRAVVNCEIGHGVDPDRALRAAGWRRTGISSTDAQAGDIVVTVQVEPTLREPSAHRTAVPVAPHLNIAPGEEPVPRQRLAAYAIISSARGILATQFSAASPTDTRWGLPGGGIDPGESPTEAVHREIWEETGQRVVLDGLLELDSRHWIGRAPDGVLEDFHGIGLIFAAHCPDPTDPVVHDVGGTTSAARWLADIREVRWGTGSWRLLTRLLP